METNLEEMIAKFHIGKILYERAFRALHKSASIEELRVPIRMLRDLTRVANRISYLEKHTEDVDTMARVIQRNFRRVTWPASAKIEGSCFTDRGCSLNVKVALPEESEITEWFSNGMGERAIAEAERRIRYWILVHVIVQMAVEESFRPLLFPQNVVVSAYASRSNPVNGTVVRECIYSIRVSRELWDAASESAKLEPITCLNSFAPRRVLSGAYEFTPVRALNDCQSGPCEVPTG